MSALIALVLVLHFHCNCFLNQQCDVSSTPTMGDMWWRIARRVQSI